MGKSRRNKSGRNRSDPLAPKIVKPPTDPELAALREKNILPVIKDLQSSDTKLRRAAAGAVANIVQNEKCRKLLLREDIVRIVLTETLTDTALESRAAGWSILRSIAAEEEGDFCVHLYRLDILTAIAHASKTVIQTITSLEPAFGTTPKAQQQVTWDIATVLLSLLSALASARDEILESIAKNDDIMRSLFSLVSASLTPTEILDETLSCLMILSEDNLQVSQLILADQSNCFRQLMKFKEAGDSKAVFACGVLHNIFSACEWHDASPGQDGASDVILVATLSRVLERAKQDPKTKQLVGVSSIDTLQLALQILASIATDLKSSIEKSSKVEEEWNGLSGDEEMGDGEDEIMKQDYEDDVDSDKADGNDNDEEEDDDMEMDEDEMEQDMALVTALDDEDDERNGPGIDEVPTLQEYIKRVLPQLVRLSNLAPSSDEAVAAQGDALSALNNIAWTLACFDFAAPDNAGIARVWNPAAKRIWSKVVVPVLATDTADVGLASIVASIAFAVTRALQASTPLTANEHRKFLALYKASKGLAGAVDAEDPFQSLGVKCIGVLGQLARDPAPLDLNREIGIFLVTVLSSLPGTPAQDAVEALNELMEIYADEDAACDEEVFWKDNFLKQLEDILPKAKSMAKSVDKRAFTELRARADEAVLNLGRFIQYKKKMHAREKV